MNGDARDGYRRWYRGIGHLSDVVFQKLIGELVEEPFKSPRSRVTKRLKYGRDICSPTSPSDNKKHAVVCA